MPAPSTVADTGRTAATPRVVFIDVLKGILTLGMVYGHVACLLGVKEFSPARALLAGGQP